MFSVLEYTGRYLALICVAFISGAATYADGSSALAILVLLGVMTTCVWQQRREGSGYRKTGIAMLLCLLAYGAGYGNIWYRDRTGIEIMHHLEDSTLSGTALVEGVSDDGYLLSFVDVNMLVTGKAYLHTEVQLTPGMFVEFQGQCLLYDSAANPRCFSYMNYMKSCGHFFYLEGTAEETGREVGTLLRVKAGLCNLTYRLTSFVQERIDRLFGEYRGIVRGMLTGDTSAMPDETLQMYRDSGIGHYFAVSGMHVGMLAATMSLLFGLIGIGTKGKSVAVAISVVVLLSICGFTPSSLRAAFMLALSGVARMVMRRSDTITTVALSAAISLAVNPYLVYNSGFILSHGAIVCFYVLYTRILLPLIDVGRQTGIRQSAETATGREAAQSNLWRRLAPKAVQAAAVPLCFWVVTVPMSGSFFGTVATYGALANLLCSPVFTGAFVLAMTALAVGCVSTAVGAVVAWPACQLLGGMEWLCSKLAAMHAATLPVAVTPYWVFCLVLVPLIGLRTSRLYATTNKGALIAGKLIPIRTYGSGWRSSRVAGTITFASAMQLSTVLVCSLAAVVYPLITPAVQITYLDVGQGDSSVAQFRNGDVLVVDGATEYYGDRVVEFCRNAGINCIDTLVLSHGHQDHGGGFAAVLDNLTVNRLCISAADNLPLTDEIVSRARELGMEVVRLAAGDSFSVGGYNIEVLWPVLDHGSLGQEENNCSLVMDLRVGEDSFIFTGDIESEVESFIIKHIDPCTVLKVPHHGSDTSSTMEFLSALSPEFSVISVGNNTYGHPSAQVLDRLDMVHSKTYITQRNRALVVYSRGRGCSIYDWKGLWGLRN